MVQGVGTPNAPPSTKPSAATGTPFAVRNALPSALVAPGPLKPSMMNTGWSGTAAVSSASVGKRTAWGARKNWLRLKPPIDVTHSPGWISAARAASVASASPMELAFSRRASRPGRRPSSTM